MCVCGVCVNVCCCGVAVLKNYNNTAIKYIRFINIFSTISFISFHFLCLFSQYNTRINGFSISQQYICSSHIWPYNTTGYAPTCLSSLSPRPRRREKLMLVSVVFCIRTFCWCCKFSKLLLDIKAKAND